MSSDLSLAQLLDALRDKRAKIPYEIGAFVMLETTEALLGRPTRVTPASIWVGADGGVSVEPDRSVTVDASAQSVCRTLGAVLVAAGPGVPPVLVDIVEEGPSTGDWQLVRLRDELEAALLPLNRSAARRVLARMVREAMGTFSTSRPPPDADPPEAALDSELDGLLDHLSQSSSLPPKNPPTAASLDTGEDGRAAGDAFVSKPALRGDAALGLPFVAAERHARHELESEPLDPSSFLPPDEDVSPPERAPLARAPGPSLERTRIDDELEQFEHSVAPGPRTGPVWALLFLLLTGASVAAVLLLRPDLFDRALGRERPVAVAPSTPAEPAVPAVRYGTLRVNVDLQGAEVFFFLGRSPVEAVGLTVGGPHEFLALLDGYAPARGFVAATAPWESDGAQRWHGLLLPLVATPEGLVGRPGASPRGDAAGFGPSLFIEALRREQGGAGGDEALEDDGSAAATASVAVAPSLERGTVRIRTEPSGAKVYALVGFAPGVTVRNVRIDSPGEILVFKQGYPVHRAPVLTSDWTEGVDGFEAELRVTLDTGAAR